MLDHGMYDRHVVSSQHMLNKQAASGWFEHGLIQSQGFTSCICCRYVLSNIESKRGIRKGDRIWQIAFGSGFKCNSAVWRSMRNNNQQHTAWDDTPKPVEP